MLSLIITIPERELLAAARSALRENLLLAAVVFIAALAATLLAAWSISRSLAHLTRAANRFREFDYATPITETSSVAEVSALADNFRSLQATPNRSDTLLQLIVRMIDHTPLQTTIHCQSSAVLVLEKAIVTLFPYLL